MSIKDFLKENEVDFTKNTIKVDILESVEKKLGIKFGEELTEYLLKYGYLGYESIEFYGINSLQGLDSDMVKQSLYLHEYYAATVPYVALENQGDGDYYLVDSDDKVYEYNSEQDQLEDTGMKLFEYILKRFQTEKF